MSRSLNMLTVAIVVLFVFSCPSVSAENKESEERESIWSQSIASFLKQDPDCIVLYHGQAKVFRSKFSVEQRKDCPAARLIAPVRAMLPFDDSFDGVLNGETIYDFMSVRSAISPEFDGFNICRVSCPAIEKLQRYLNNHSRTLMRGSRKIGVVDSGYAKGWFDFDKQKLSSDIYICIISADTFVSATSLGYFDSGRFPIALSEGSMGKRCIDFFESAKGESFLAQCVFRSTNKYSKPDISKLVRKLEYSRDGSLSESPFTFTINTYEDNIEQVSPILAYFNNEGKIDRASKSKFRVSIQSLPWYFYTKLHYLMSSGIQGEY